MVTHAHLEESLLSPFWAPGVSAEPIVQSVLVTPSNEFHGMSSSYTSIDVVVDSSFVAHEVLIDSELSFKWSISVNFIFN